MREGEGGKAYICTVCILRERERKGGIWRGGARNCRVAAPLLSSVWAAVGTPRRDDERRGRRGRRVDESSFAVVYVGRSRRSRKGGGGGGVGEPFPAIRARRAPDPPRLRLSSDGSRTRRKGDGGRPREKRSAEAAPRARIAWNRPSPRPPHTDGQYRRRDGCWPKCACCRAVGRREVTFLLYARLLISGRTFLALCCSTSETRVKRMRGASFLFFFCYVWRETSAEYSPLRDVSQLKLRWHAVCRTLSTEIA